MVNEVGVEGGWEEVGRVWNGGEKYLRGEKAFVVGSVATDWIGFSVPGQRLVAPNQLDST